MIAIVDTLAILLNDALALDAWIIYQFAKLIGLILLLCTTIWVISLYLGTLFKVVRAREQHAEHSSTGTHGTSVSKVSIDRDNKLLKQIAKQTVLALFCVASTLIILFTFLPTFWVPYEQFDPFWSTRFIAAGLGLDITTNVMLFILGFAYNQSLYDKMCSRMDRKISKCCEEAVIMAVERKEAPSEQSKTQMSSLKTVSNIKTSIATASTGATLTAPISPTPERDLSSHASANSQNSPPPPPGSVQQQYEEIANMSSIGSLVVGSPLNTGDFMLNFKDDEDAFPYAD